MSDPKMFSDGLITPFIDAAQQQDQDRHEETIDGRRLATWQDIKRLGQTVNELMAENEDLTAEVTRLTQELADAEQQLTVLRPGGLYAWKSKYEQLTQEHERLKALFLRAIDAFEDEGYYHAASGYRIEMAEGRKPRP